MSIYDSFADKPNRIKEEGQEITLRFSRIDDNTGKVTWNIPPGFKGCKGDGVYDGIVITVSRIPANYIESSPKDGTYYIGDITVDPDLHSGSKLSQEEGKEVLVVGAFYNDRTTTELEVSDLEPRTAYYFSGYAVDNVARYHREGVHSYSLPTGIEESNSEELTPAEHVVEIEEEVRLSTATGVDAGKTYLIKADINEEDDVEISVKGSESKTYGSMIEAINRQYMLLDDAYQSPTFPFRDTVFQIDGKFYYWDGENKTEITPIESSTDPTTSTNGDLWYDTDDKILYEYNGGWVPQQLIFYDFDINNPVDGTIWFDGTVAREWKNGVWCELNTIIDTVNPLLPPKLFGNTFWFKTDTGEFFERNRELKKWDEALVIYYSKDPNNITIGDFWFDESKQKVFERASGPSWQEIVNVDIRESAPVPLASVEPEDPQQAFLYILDQQALFEWSTGTSEWVPVSVAVYPTDPTDRESCNLWWNSATDTVFIWDDQNNIWLQADNFFQQEVDPALAPKLDEGTVWYNPTTEELLRILSTTCEKVDFINETFNPISDIPVGLYWKDGDTFKIWIGSSWSPIDPQPLEWPGDPTLLAVGTYWLDGGGTLQILESTAPSVWSVVTVASKDPKPDEGFLWYNTVENQMYKWNIDQWEKTTGVVFVELERREKFEERDKLIFKTRKKGCDALFRLKAEEKSIITALKSNVRYRIHTEGKDLVEGYPSYKRLGVGDDGSPDERRELQDTIRQILGEPSTKVELSKANIDVCIDNALAQLRKFGGLSYKRGFFFLDIKPNQQNYVLTDRCVDFHKIVDIKAVYRLRSGFLQGAYAGHDIYGYAALKQLYTLGSFDILSFHLVSSFIEELETLFATRITFQWIERIRELRMYNAFYRKERVLVDASIERTEQDLMVDRGTKMWIQRWAVAEAKMILSQSRGKFQTLPGPNGSTVLNAQELITQSEAEKAVLMEELHDISMQGIEEVGLGAYFVLG